MNLNREKLGLVLIALAGVFTLFMFFLFDRIPQDISYHNFSDTQAYFSIPNILNVLSNIPFIVIGITGLISLGAKRPSVAIVQSNAMAYWILFGSTAVVGLGSGYYHLSPSNETLVWDRLPMTLAFMGLYSIIISEFISETKGKLLLFPLLFAGLFSVLYWWYTESCGVGDLRYYAVVQFFPIVTIPIILLLFKSKFTSTSGYWILLGTYILAKLFEHFDVQIHQYLIYFSGHSIKHLFPAIGLYFLLQSYRTRKTIHQ